jgi:hypothetical protein
VELDYIDYDGEDFGVNSSIEFIRPYDGYKPLHKLKTFPLEYHPEKDAVVARIMARGKRFISLMKTHHQWYEGAAESLSQTALDEDGDPSLQSIMVRYSFPLIVNTAKWLQVKGRVMIDCKTFSRTFPSHKTHFRYGKRVIRIEAGDHMNLSDDDFLMCHHTVMGYSLNKKRWCYFEIDLLREIDFDTNAFESLLLPRDQKEMIHSLVKIHADAKLQFNDLIKGKGMGMVFLLHGAPGVGKTLTAGINTFYSPRQLT